VLADVEGSVAPQVEHFFAPFEILAPHFSQIIFNSFLIRPDV